MTKVTYRCDKCFALSTASNEFHSGSLCRSCWTGSLSIITNESENDRPKLEVGSDFVAPPTSHEIERAILESQSFPGMKAPDRGKPEVTRGPLPDAPAVVMYCDDSPLRPGYIPVPGDQDNLLIFPLHDGRQLELHCGRTAFAHFVAILAAAAVDDAEEHF